MKILMLNYEFPPIGGGGGQAHRALLYQYADRPDLEVEVLTSAPRPGLFLERPARNILVFKMGIRKKNLHVWRRGEVLEWLLKAGPCYRRLVKSGEHDLVHAFFGFPTGWLCYRTARRLPYVISLRGSDVPGGNARLQLDYKVLGPLVFRPIWKRASALVACSEGLRSRALQFLPSAGIDVIPNGVDLEQFHPADAACATRDTANEPLKLLTVGRLSVTKRLPLLVSMVERLHGQGCPAQLTIVGGGALEPELRRLLGRKGLRGAITLVGRCDGTEMPEIYRQHDLFVSASMQEGMSNAMLEAMASGLPIVTTCCEGVDELIADNGVVVQSADPASLAAEIANLAGNAKALQTMSRAARKRAETFTWAQAASRYLDLYRRVAGGN